MPFGAIFGLLFFITLAVWLTVGAADAPLVPRLCLALTALSLVVGLVLRRGWARWAGAGFSAGVTLLMLRWISVEPGVAPLVFLVGAVGTVGLLVVPATGDAGTPVRTSGSVLGRSALGLAALGGLGFVGSVLLGVEPVRSSVPGSTPQEARPVAARGYARIVWSDFGSGIEQARRDERPMVVVFVTSWCGYCKKMDRNTFKDPEVVDTLSGLVTVRVDTEETRERNGFTGAALASRFGVRGTPTVALLGPDGQLIDRRSGYLDAQAFLGWLDRSLPEVAPRRSTTGLIRTTSP